MVVLFCVRTAPNPYKETSAETIVSLLGSYNANYNSGVLLSSVLIWVKVSC